MSLNAENETGTKTVVTPENASKNNLQPHLILVVSLIALLLAFFANYQNWHNKTSLNEQQQITQTSQLAIKETLKEWQTNQQTQSAAVQQQINTLSTTLNKTLKQRFYQKQDWLLYKAQYYLELAQINVHWSDHHTSSIALLQNADEILQSQHTQQILIIRQQIASEIQQIKQLNSTDTAGILSQLDAAANAVNQLKVKQNIDHLTASAPPPASQEDGSWSGRIHNSLRVLKNMLVIRHHDQPFEPILFPQYQALLRENIRLNIQEAQWAVLQNNAAVYQQVLNQAIANIQRNFDSKDAGVAALITQLQTLQKESIISNTSIDLKSLNLLNTYLENQQQEVPAQETPAQETPAPEAPAQAAPVNEGNPS